ncbi:MAG TPA: ATP-binding protein [Pyrinomonadaceae bacterium]
MTGKQAQSIQAADSSRALFHEMIGSMREGVVMVDVTSTVTAFNPAAQVMFGDTAVNGQRSLSDIISDEKIHAAFRDALESGMRSELQTEIVVKNDKRVYDLRVAPLSFADSKSAIGIFYDITRLERLERVRQAFLSNVSHELRTPLTSILAFCETLADGALDDPQNNRRFLEIIRRNAERMHHLIDDILELSSIEAGKTKINPKYFSLSPLVNDIWASRAEKSQGHGLAFKNEVPADVVIFADPRRVEQILINLIDNAIKFNIPGGEVIVSYQRSAGQYHIQVSDTGEGMAAEHLPRIFERFYRADAARSRELGGTGLGLAIVKHLSRLHGGEARVFSTVGTGTTFIIDLPAEA